MAAHAIAPRDLYGPIAEPYPYTRAGLARARTWLHAMITWYERRQRYQRTVGELSALSNHVLADIGIDRHEIRAVARQLSQRSA